MNTTWVAQRVNQLLSKPCWHDNLTLGKLISFSTLNGIGTLAFLAIQIPLIEIAKTHYLLATLIAGTVGLLAKFVLTGLITYRGHR